jgi:hypothetical protein
MAGLLSFVASLTVVGSAPADDGRPVGVPPLEEVLAAHDGHLKALARLRISWIEVGAVFDSRRVFSVEMTAFERAGFKERRRLTGVERSSLESAPLELPTNLVEDAWWARLARIFAEGDPESGRKLGKPMITVVDGRRSTMYAAYPGPGGAPDTTRPDRDWWYAIVENKPLIRTTFARPLLPAFFFNDGIPLTEEWRRERPLIVRTGFGRVAVVSSRVEGDGTVQLLGPGPGYIPDERLVWRGLTQEEMRERLVASPSIHEMRSWSEWRVNGRVLKWMQPPELPPVPEVYVNRILPDDDPSTSYDESIVVCRVTAVSRGAELSSVEGFPDELRGKQVDVVDKLLRTAVRHHPDGRIQVLATDLDLEKKK